MLNLKTNKTDFTAKAPRTPRKTKKDKNKNPLNSHRPFAFLGVLGALAVKITFLFNFWGGYVQPF
jgi:hypothetical protein